MKTNLQGWKAHFDHYGVAPITPPIVGELFRDGFFDAAIDRIIEDARDIELDIAHEQLVAAQYPPRVDEPVGDPPNDEYAWCPVCAAWVEPEGALYAWGLSSHCPHCWEMIE